VRAGPFTIHLKIPMTVSVYALFHGDFGSLVIIGDGIHFDIGDGIRFDTWSNT
jgi:hypothetical protein